MRRHIPAVAAALAAVLPTATASAALAPARTPFTFALLGDTPCGPTQRAAFPQLVDAINADPRVRLALHAGDIESGSSTCEEPVRT